MSGTDRTQPITMGGPAVILVESQLGENIGMASRAMLNSGLDDLRLVRPRDGWPNPRSRSAASGADMVLDNAQVFEKTEDALADLTHVYAATARPRDMIKTVLTPRRAIAEMRGISADGGKIGIMFGGERSGLNNDDIALSNKVVQIPLNPGFSSLNLSHAVAIISYEWYQSVDETEPAFIPEARTPPATKGELMIFFERLEAMLDESGFFHIAEKRPIMARNIRSIFQRAELMEQEVKTMHGIISCLSRMLGRED